MKDIGLSTDLLRTEIIFNFILTIGKLSDKFKTNKFVFAWDSRKNFRKEKFPFYKANRKDERKTEEQEFLDNIAYPQFTTLRRSVLNDMGFRNILIQTGMEADDIIAKVSKDNWEKEQTIISTDKDLFQLLTDKCQIFRMLPSSINILYTKKAFMDEWKGIIPLQWSELRSISGDYSDNIPGITGVGEPTALKYLIGELKSHHKTFINIDSEEGKEIIKRNREIVTLPHSEMRSIELQEDEFTLENVVYTFKQLDFKSLLTEGELKKWGARTCL
uniref:Putative exonuclease n=1 Tax=viral metagenome TaxID=1070528 RepID=A0A6M3L380_9ZZZZ